MENTLFQRAGEIEVPFAELFRPKSIENIAGQSQLLGKGAPFRKSLDSLSLGSFILWGPPGCGKTTLALIVADHVKEHFVRFSAVTGGVKDVRRIVGEASERRASGVGTILFVDEIHRFSRSQQDAFLPHVENGTIRLIGATTENPSFTVNAPLLSRCSVHVLTALSRSEIAGMLSDIVSRKDFQDRYGVRVSPEACQLIAEAADGDARRSLNILEQLTGTASSGEVSEEMVGELIQSSPLMYDRSGEEHYNLISAFHKSMRSSDPHGTLYWLGRMIKSGEDPLYIGRRMIRFATEDVGLADPSALTVAMRAVDSYRFLGSPEGDLAIAEAAVYLSLAPKSNSVYKAWNLVLSTVMEKGSLPVPLHLRNAPTKLMKEMDYGRGYQYAHDMPGGVVTHSNLPDELGDKEFYKPSDSGREKRLSQELAQWKKLRRTARIDERNGNG